MPNSRPNILFICTDQQRFDSLGCYGNEHARTPAIDQLAADGVIYEQCYVQSPVCSPSRASLLTARYVHAHGLYANGVSLPAHWPLFTKALADGGYDCGLVGKWHLSACFQGRTEPRLDDGFRVFQWAHDPTHGSPQNMYHRWLEENYPDVYAQAIANGPGRGRHEAAPFDAMPTETHYSHWVGTQSIEFIEASRDEEQPFFLWVNFFDPHHPFVAPQEYLDRFDAETLPAPLGSLDDLRDRPAILSEASEKSYAGFARGFTEYTPEQMRQVVRANYAMVALIDDEVQRILDALAATGRLDNTLVIFTSDHGLLLKGPMLYEGAVRVPLILKWPGVLPAGERVTPLVEWIDLNDTMLAAAGLSPLPGSQAQSLLPLAHGDETSARGWALCEYRDSGHPYDPRVDATMLRRGPYKLVVFHGAPATERPRSGELYDLHADPHELHNLWDSPDYAAVRIELQELLLDTLVATEDRTQPREAYW